jgi:hypothetical protein
MIRDLAKEFKGYKMNKVAYNKLLPKQQENHNYQKLSAVLAEYGYTTYRMHDDYNGADFHAVHIDGKVLKIQLKGRVTIDKKYLNKGIFIGFSNDRLTWYVYPHDIFFKIVTKHSKGAKVNGSRSFTGIPKWLLPLISKYKL